MSALKFVQIYFYIRMQRTDLNLSYSTQEEILSGVSQGSALGHPFH